MLGRAHGFLLLPVTLTLVIVGALAYAMTREAGMGISGVDAEYDTEVARYTAEAALNLARWQNYQQKCSNDPAPLFAGTPLYRYRLATGNIGTTDADKVGTMTLASAVTVKDNSNNEKGGIVLEVVSTTATVPAGSRRIVRTVPRYNLDDRKVATIRGIGSASSFISTAAGAAPQDAASYIELTDNGSDQSYGLLRFGFGTLPKNALVKEATLRLERYQGEFNLLSFNRRLDIQRLTTSWDAATATWAAPWSKPGGDYAPEPIASSIIYADGPYTWRLDALVAGWVNGTLPNYGMLLKPVKLDKSRFRAFASTDGNGPELTVTYYERCT